MSDLPSDAEVARINAIAHARRAATEPLVPEAPSAVLPPDTDAPGLTPVERRDVFCVWGFPDEATALSALRATRFAVEAAVHAGDEAVTTAILDAIAPYRMSDAGYRLENTFTYLIAQA